MLFHEIYSKYFHTVEAIVREASHAELSPRDIRQIVEKNAFSESGLTIPDALRSGKWPFLKNGRQSVLRSPAQMPLTLLEKRWLKSLLLDPRIQLFQPPVDGLEDIQPLYRPEDIVWFDRYGDSDPYSDANYIQCFQTILSAIREHWEVLIHYLPPSGNAFKLYCYPYTLEYSEKDDKFRLQALAAHGSVTLNLSRIQRCETRAGCRKVLEIPPAPKTRLVLRLEDERNALERAMLHFSHLEKETSRLDDGSYQIILWYASEDEAELLIRVLSFGPQIQVLAPDHFIRSLSKRLNRQKNLRTP